MRGLTDGGARRVGQAVDAADEWSGAEHTTRDGQDTMTTNGQTMDLARIGMAVDGALSITMNRRRALRLLGTAGAAAVIAGVAQTGPALAGPSAGGLFTTSDLNLRAKPKSTAKILLVIPEGAPVEEIGRSSNGYVKVVYKGKRGYAHGDYLTSTAMGNDPQITGLNSTNTDVNLRSGPSTGHDVLRVLAPDSPLSVSDTVENGFRYVVHLGLAGWVWDAFIGGSGPAGPSAGPEKLTTTSALNLRSTASTNAAVLMVIPSGARVGDLEQSSNGFRKVSYAGSIGWSWADYLV